MRLLGECGNQLPQAISGQRPQLSAAKSNIPPVIAETEQNFGNRTLAAAAVAGQGNPGTGRQFKVETVQHLPLTVIGKRDVLQGQGEAVRQRQR